MGRSVYPPPGARKSVQRGVLSVLAGSTGTATVAAVNTAKSDLRFLGSNAVAAVNISLTNSTTITVNNNGNSTDAVVSWELTEFY